MIQLIGGLLMAGLIGVLMLVGLAVSVLLAVKLLIRLIEHSFD